MWDAQSDQQYPEPLQAAAMPSGMSVHARQTPPLLLTPMPLLHRQSIDSFGATMARAALNSCSTTDSAATVRCSTSAMRRSPGRLRAHAERLPTSMTAERDDGADVYPRHHCCRPAQRRARASWQHLQFSTSYFAQSHATDDAARHGAKCPRLAPRCSL